MTMDRTGLHVLAPEECLDLLSHHHYVRLGRIAFRSDGDLVVLPVNYRLHQGAVIFRTDPGAKLHAVREGQRVAFEVDAVDPAWQEGWSVLVQGAAEEVTDPAETEALASLPLWTWAPGEKAIYVRINPAKITGRRIV